MGHDGVKLWIPAQAYTLALKFFEGVLGALLAYAVYSSFLRRGERKLKKVDSLKRAKRKRNRHLMRSNPYSHTEPTIQEASNETTPGLDHPSEDQISCVERFQQWTLDMKAMVLSPHNLPAKSIRVRKVCVIFCTLFLIYLALLTHDAVIHIEERTCQIEGWLETLLFLVVLCQSDWCFTVTLRKHSPLIKSNSDHSSLLVWFLKGNSSKPSAQETAAIKEGNPNKGNEKGPMREDTGMVKGKPVEFRSRTSITADTKEGGLDVMVEPTQHTIEPTASKKESIVREPTQTQDGSEVDSPPSEKLNRRLSLTNESDMDNLDYPSFMKRNSSTTNSSPKALESTLTMTQSINSTTDVATTKEISSPKDTTEEEENLPPKKPSCSSQMDWLKFFGCLYALSLILLIVFSAGHSTVTVKNGHHRGLLLCSMYFERPQVLISCIIVLILNTVLKLIMVSRSVHNCLYRLYERRHRFDREHLRQKDAQLVTLLADKLVVTLYGCVPATMFCLILILVCILDVSLPDVHVLIPLAHIYICFSLVMLGGISEFAVSSRSNRSVCFPHLHSRIRKRILNYMSNACTESSLMSKSEKSATQLSEFEDLWDEEDGDSSENYWYENSAVSTTVTQTLSSMTETRLSVSVGVDTYTRTLK